MGTQAVGGYELKRILSNQTTPPRCQDAAVFFVKKREQGTRLSKTGRPLGAQRQLLSREAANAPSGVIQEQEDADDEQDSPAVWSAATKMNDGSINHRALLVNARRLVIKVGTGVVCNAENEFDPRQVAGLAASISGLVNAGRQVVLVSSGAVTLGAAELGIHRSRLKDASVTRACAAVGQCKLMQAYAESFRPHGIKVAQVLVTEDDFSDLKRYSILRQTFERLLKLGAVPIVNENDTVTNIYTEQAPVFRDNDRLAALVLSKLDADALACSPMSTAFFTVQLKS